MAKDRPGISINEIGWHPNKSTTVPIVVADNKDLLSSDIIASGVPILVFPGYGTSRKGIIRMLHGFAEQRHHVAIVDLPFSHREIRGKRDLAEQLAREGPHEAGDALRKEYRTDTAQKNSDATAGENAKGEYPKEQEDEPIKALGHSKGAAILGRAMDEDHAKIGDVALVQPPELERPNPIEVTPLEEQRLINELLINMGLNSLSKGINHRELRAAINVLRTFLKDDRTRQFPIFAGPIVVGSQVESVFTHVELGNTVHVIASFNDMVFPGKQILDTLSVAGQAKTTEHSWVLEGGRLLFYEEPNLFHLNGDTPAGMRLLNTSLGRLENPNVHEAIPIYPGWLTR